VLNRHRRARPSEPTKGVVNVARTLFHHVECGTRRSRFLFSVPRNGTARYGTRDPQLMAMPSLAEVSGYFKDEGLTETPVQNARA
jgi:hypothetical protein